MPCRLPLSQIAQRLILATWKGQPAGAVSSNYNYAYTLSDTVPVGKFWVIWYGSVISLQTGGSVRTALYAINPGLLPFGNSVAYSRNHNFFQGDVIPTITNGAPVGPFARRVDELNDNNTDSYANGAELVAIRTHKLILPEGWTIMASGQSGGFGVGGGLNEQYQLNFAYAEFSNDESDAFIGPVDF